VVAGRQARWVSRLKHRLVTRQFDLDAFNMNDETIGRFLDLMHRYRPRILRGYTSALIELGRWAEEKRVKLPPLGSIATTAEQVLPEQRNALEAAFKAPVYNQYGCAETGGVSYECNHHTGLHIASEHCIVEIVDEEGHPVPPGETGLVALTNLDNEATPFVRYVNGDMASLLPDPCPCGRNLPLMSAVTGRTADMIIGLNGNRVHGEFFTHLLNESRWTETLPVRAFQVVQTDRDRLEFRIVAGRSPKDTEVQQLIGRMQEYLGLMTIELQCVERIDRSRSGKQRFTLRLWNPDEDKEARETDNIHRLAAHRGI
jgi:phenylacetate-CoA ligase